MSNEECKEQQLQRRYSNLSDIVELKKDELKPYVARKLQLSGELSINEVKFDPEAIYDNVRMSANKSPRFKSKSQENYDGGPVAIPSKK